MRVILPNARAYDLAGTGSHSHFSTEHCCVCGRPVKNKTEWLLLTRATDGSMEFAIDHPNEATEEERNFTLWVAPIGFDCLKKHPELKTAVL